MPHLTLEYTRNLASFDTAQALAALNTAMFDSGLFGEPDIKSRACAIEHFQVGIRPAARAFAHVRIALLAGRSDAERKGLAEAALQALSSLMPTGLPDNCEIQLSVETVELDRASYAKAVHHG